MYQILKYSREVFVFKSCLELENLLDNNWQFNTNRIDEITYIIKKYEKWRLNNAFSKERWTKICSGILSVLYVWTGNTYIGNEKNFIIRKVFQSFFSELCELIVKIDSNDWVVNRREKGFANKVKYEGVIYRYIGSSKSTNKSVIYPCFNDIYVSWSKEETSSYVKSKLYGPITWISCTATHDRFGLDIEGFEEYCNKHFRGNYYITRGNEREVVYPTIDNCINSIKVIEYGEDCNENVRVVR